MNSQTKMVDAFTKKLNNVSLNEEDTKVLELSNKYVKELAQDPSPENLYILSNILKTVIDEGFRQRVDYLNQIADVQSTDHGTKAMFEIDIDDLKAFYQAKSATTERSKISSKKFQLETDEISVRPVVNFVDLVNGRVDLTDVAEKAITALENEMAVTVQNTLYEAFKGTDSPNYATGSGITKGAFDPILTAMKRVNGSATILGDIEALAQFTELSGFNNNVADAYAIEHNENGHIGNYLGAQIMQLNNPYLPSSFDTELRKDLIYVFPNAAPSLRPVKVHLEGGLQGMSHTSIDSKQVEFRFDQYVGVGVIGARRLLGVYEDKDLA